MPASEVSKRWNSMRRPVTFKGTQPMTITPPGMREAAPRESWWLDPDFYRRRAREQARMALSKFGQSGSLTTAGVEARTIARKHSIFGDYMERPLYRPDGE